MASYTATVTAPDVSKFVPTTYGLPAGSVVQALHQRYLDTDILIAALNSRGWQKGTQWDIDVRPMELR